ncbi:hypothetical protein [Myxacorys almedinensis]|uniref:Uncharacterized protein n=1 Tax=Myxacorys almedinensis A TaxID=2690445 RepID=A0A8J8CL11_9CYAN|nr:hypothetical protein [Myxacorys almedinensis]NDJ19146.1 hypothetical protein [Myxacorys almedinensis A]
MSVYSFDHYSIPCPICDRTSDVRSVRLMKGLLTCPHCRSRFVVSVSGHYVRDPFARKRLVTNERKLRRQSRPLARILRDSGVARHSRFIGILGSLLILGFTMSFLSGAGGQTRFIQGWIEQIVRVSEAPE